MSRKPIACMVLVLAGLLGASVAASRRRRHQSSGEETHRPVDQSDGAVACRAQLQGRDVARQQANAHRVSPNSIVFANRPVRAAGHVLTSHFIREWDVGNDSFAKVRPTPPSRC